MCMFNATFFPVYAVFYPSQLFITNMMKSTWSTYSMTLFKRSNKFRHTFGNDAINSVMNFKINIVV